MLITLIRASDLSLVTENTTFPTNLSRKSQIAWISYNAICFKAASHFLTKFTSISRRHHLDLVANCLLTGDMI